jgi:hypothetical protein
MKGKKAIDKKELNIIKGVEVIKSSPEEVKSRNILYNTIQTASYIAHSPNNIANNLGSESSCIKVNAAIVSVADIIDANNNISVNDK